MADRKQNSLRLRSRVDLAIRYEPHYLGLYVHRLILNILKTSYEQLQQRERLKQSIGQQIF